MTALSTRVGLAAAAALALTTAGPAQAAPSDNGPGAPTAIMTGEASDGAFLGGTFAPSRVVLDPAGHLMAVGMATASLTGPPGSVQRRFQQSVSVPINRAATQSTCEALDLVLGPADTEMNGQPVHMDWTDFNITKRQGPGSRLQVPLCGFSRLLPSDAGDAGLVDPLNEIIALASWHP